MWETSTYESMCIIYSKGTEMAEKLVRLIDEELAYSTPRSTRLQELSETLKNILSVTGSDDTEHQADRSIEAPELEEK